MVNELMIVMTNDDHGVGMNPTTGRDSRGDRIKQNF